MGSLTSAFNIATSALNADQAAINISANNTANANTPGYTREVPVWTDTDAISINNQPVMTAVSVTAQSQQNLVLQQTLNQATQAQQQSSTEMSTMTNVSDIFSSSDSSSNTSGIGGSITNFFNALSSLQSDPSDGPTRQGVITAAQDLASSFNSAATQIEQQTSSANQSVVTVVQQINSLTAQIATLNNEISANPPNTDDNTLVDQQQQLISQLSQYVGLNQVTTQSGAITLSTSNGALLVSEGQSYSLSTSAVNGNMDVFSSAVPTGQSTDISATLTGGQLGGLLQSLNTYIPTVQNQLNTLAYDLGSAINTAQEAGVDINGTAGTALFSLPSDATSSDPAGSAAGISVSITNPDLIAAATTGEGASGNSNATTLLNVGTSNSVDGATPNSYYSSIVSSLGSLVSTMTSNNTAQQANVTQLTSQVSSLSGVNLDEEASNLTLYERSYQAASQVFTIVDNLMASVLNLGEQTTVS